MAIVARATRQHFEQTELLRQQLEASAREPAGKSLPGAKLPKKVPPKAPAPTARLGPGPAPARAYREGGPQQGQCAPAAAAVAANISSANNHVDPADELDTNGTSTFPATRDPFLDKFTSPVHRKQRPHFTPSFSQTLTQPRRAPPPLYRRPSSASSSHTNEPATPTRATASGASTARDAIRPRSRTHMKVLAQFDRMVRGWLPVSKGGPATLSSIQNMSNEAKCQFALNGLAYFAGVDPKYADAVDGGLSWTMTAPPEDGRMGASILEELLQVAESLIVMRKDTFGFMAPAEWTEPNQGENGGPLEHYRQTPLQQYQTESMLLIDYVRDMRKHLEKLKEKNDRLEQQEQSLIKTIEAVTEQVEITKETCRRNEIKTKVFARNKQQIQQEHDKLTEKIDDIDATIELTKKAIGVTGEKLNDHLILTMDEKETLAKLKKDLVDTLFLLKGTTDHDQQLRHAVETASVDRDNLKTQVEILEQAVQAMRTYVDRFIFGRVEQGRVGGKEFYTPLGTDPEVPEFLRWSGPPIVKLDYTKQDTELLVREMWALKTINDEARRSKVLPKLSLPHFFSEYLQERFEKHEARVEFAYNFVGALETYMSPPHNPDLELFFHMLTSGVSEEHFYDEMTMLAHLKKRIMQMDKLDTVQDGLVEKDIFFTGLGLLFPTKSEEQFRKLQNIIFDKNMQSWGPSGELQVDCLALLGDEGPAEPAFLREIRQQYHDEVSKFPEEIRIALVRAAVERQRLVKGFNSTQQQQQSQQSSQGRNKNQVIHEEALVEALVEALPARGFSLMGHKNPPRSKFIQRLLQSHISPGMYFLPAGQVCSVLQAVDPNKKFAEITKYMVRGLGLDMVRKADGTEVVAEVHAKADLSEQGGLPGSAVGLHLTKEAELDDIYDVEQPVDIAIFIKRLNTLFLHRKGHYVADVELSHLAELRKLTPSERTYKRGEKEEEEARRQKREEERRQSQHGAQHFDDGSVEQGPVITMADVNGQEALDTEDEGDVAPECKHDPDFAQAEEEQIREQTQPTQERDYRAKVSGLQQSFRPLASLNTPLTGKGSGK